MWSGGIQCRAVPPARHDLPEVVAIWDDDDGQPAIAKGRYRIGQPALGIENMLEHVLDDDGIAALAVSLLKKSWTMLTPWLLTEFRQPVCGLVADIGVRIVLHDVAELSAAASDLHDT